MSRTQATEMIGERVELVASRMRIGPMAARALLTDESVKTLAQSLVFHIAEEALGVS